jgi:putative endonuclease
MKLWELFHQSEPGGQAAKTGRYGEAVAKKQLRKEGYRILACNARVMHEEIDIVAQNRHVRVFAEVKTRRQKPDAESKWGTPSDAVTHEKRRHLLSAAKAFNATHPTRRTSRMDIIEVYLDPAERERCSVLAVRHIEDAFRA